MRKVMYWAIATMLVIGIGGYAYAAGPIATATPMVKMEKGAKVFILGAGFTPMQAVKILLTDVNGVTSDIDAESAPTPVVADSKGEWSVVWNPGQFISKKMIKEGVTTLKITDKAYNLLAHVSVAFVKDDAMMMGGKQPLVVAQPMVDMVKDAEVAIQGLGFKPNQELAIIFTDATGATADLETYLDPAPVVTNAKGEFSTNWKCGRYIDKKLIKPGVTAIRVTDTDYTLLAHDSIAFIKK